MPLIVGMKPLRIDSYTRRAAVPVGSGAQVPGRKSLASGDWRESILSPKGQVLEGRKPAFSCPARLPLQKQQQAHFTGVKHATSINRPYLAPLISTSPLTYYPASLCFPEFRHYDGDAVPGVPSMIRPTILRCQRGAPWATPLGITMKWPLTKEQSPPFTRPSETGACLRSAN
jgi:hypothetical protein